MGIVGGHGGGICPWSPRWDLLAGTEQGLFRGRGDGIRRRSQSWVFLAGADITKGKLIDTLNKIELCILFVMASHFNRC